MACLEKQRSKSWFPARLEHALFGTILIEFVAYIDISTILSQVPVAIFRDLKGGKCKTAMDFYLIFCIAISVTDNKVKRKKITICHRKCHNFV